VRSNLKPKLFKYQYNMIKPNTQYLAQGSTTIDYRRYQKLACNINKKASRITGTRNNGTYEFQSGILELKFTESPSTDMPIPEGFIEARINGEIPEEIVILLKNF